MDFRGCYLDSRAIVLGEGEQQLGFAEDSPAFDCIGDESRPCCGVQAFGQTAVAEGILDGSDERGWVLKAASACELPAGSPRRARDRGMGIDDPFQAPRASYGADA
jgi:hypothetical protein